MSVGMRRVTLTGSDSGCAFARCIAFSHASEMGCEFPIDPSELPGAEMSASSSTAFSSTTTSFSSSFVSPSPPRCADPPTAPPIAGALSTSSPPPLSLASCAAERCCSSSFRTAPSCALRAVSEDIVFASRIRRSISALNASKLIAREPTMVRRSCTGTSAHADEAAVASMAKAERTCGAAIEMVLLTSVRERSSPRHIDATAIAASGA
mmetsp:Transcript_39930/g.98776  ORF Transcript_39930/g.98776 Transcript_39930/m.98776 type:complete len:209 (-) Transcript_39930:40-666(-)